MSFEIKLANPRGFCAGVDRAIDTVKRALELFGAPIYVRHEVVHNRSVVQDLLDKGVIFVDDLKDLPVEEGVLIFSAHGVSQEIYDQAQASKFKVFDATCPLVSKVHMEVMQQSQIGVDCVFIGHANHPEAEGTMGRYNHAQGGSIHLISSLDDVVDLDLPRDMELFCATQTTLSVEDTKAIIGALRKKFPLLKEPKKDDICYATQNRQDAVKQLALEVDMLLVVGSKESSNSNRLKELAEYMGIKSYLIDSSSYIKDSWLQGMGKIGVTSGASAPEYLVEEVITFLQSKGGVLTEILSRDPEGINFSLPKELMI